MRKTKWKAVRSTDILGSRREISSLGIDRGFLEEAAPEPDKGRKGLGAEGGEVVHSRPPRSINKRMAQAWGALSYLLWPGAGSSGARGQSGEGSSGTWGPAEDCEQVSKGPMPSKPSPGGWVPSAHHADDVWVDGLNEDPAGAPHALHQLIEGCPLHLLPLKVGHTVQEVKHHPALGQLPAQQLMQLRSWHIWEGGRGLSLGPRLPQLWGPSEIQGSLPRPQTPCSCGIATTPCREQRIPVSFSILRSKGASSLPSSRLRGHDGLI